MFGNCSCDGNRQQAAPSFVTKQGAKQKIIRGRGGTNVEVTDLRDRRGHGDDVSGDWGGKR